MKTIKELEAGKKFAVERGQLQALKDVLGLIDELRNEYPMVDGVCKIKGMKRTHMIEELKKRINGTSEKVENGK